MVGQVKTFESFTAYAAHRQVSPAYITKLFNQKRLDEAIHIDEKGRKLIHREKADELLYGSLRERPDARERIEAGDVEPAQTTSKGIPNYADSRAVREAFVARLAKLDYEERQGKLVEADKVRLQAFELARKVRDALLAIPDRVASTCAHETSEHEVHKLISDEIVQVLQRLTEDAKR